MRRQGFRLTLVSAAAAATLAAACSSATDPKSSTASGLSASEAGAVASAFVTQVYGAVGSATNLDRSDPGALAFLRAPRAGAADARARGTSRFDLSPVSFTRACPLGGTVTGTASFVDNLDAKGTGSLASTVTSTPQACVVSAGDRNVAVTGAPSIAMAVSVPLTAFAQSGTAVFTVTGGFTWSGGSCQLNYTANVAPNGTGTVAGTVCGQSVSRSF